MCERKILPAHLFGAAFIQHLLPEQTASNDYVDIVVRGEGELIIKDLANAIAPNQPLDDVAGITYTS